ncbi:4-sulfomuconolactone hydrolase [Gracilariopsis chorda]|uniref:4-sulfomuconolactone hydrolase n=1 Tax=Gracilariopsis chorda TaxID=448386 RepID=A0A2V3ING0_9FLOR|nr:4-sulfomuconolactone hydrolase [Gracilariopsis chorda]|eukprot:PXF43589.1 4-sulfomuconolactone hydrolase [Gracilariopsis chorda]
MKVDAHVHIWDTRFKPHKEHPLPPIQATATDLLANMDKANVQKAVIVQPINYKFNHDCITTAVKQHPHRFVAVALMDSTLPAQQACSTLQTLVQQHDFRGFRINPTFTADGFANECVHALTDCAAKLDVPVTLFARPQHVDDVTKLVQQHAQSKIIVDHFGFVDSKESRERLLYLSRYGNVYVKVSAWFRVSSQRWPHKDVHELLSDLIGAYGAHRLLLGSDYPFVKQEYSYQDAMNVVHQVDKVCEKDKQWMCGDTASVLYKL